MSNELFEAQQALKLLEQARAHHDDNDGRVVDLGALATTMAASPSGRIALGEVVRDSGIIEALVAAIARRVARLLAGRQERQQPVETKPGQAAGAPEPAPPKPAAPALPPVASLTLDFNLFGREQDGYPPLEYELVELDDRYEVQLKGDTTQLAWGSKADLRVGFLDAAGKGIQFPEGSAYDHSTRFVAISDTGGVVTLGPGAEAEMRKSAADTPNFREAEYQRTRGMDVPLKFPRQTDGRVFEVNVEYVGPDGVTVRHHKPIRFPRIA